MPLIPKALPKVKPTQSKAYPKIRVGLRDGFASDHLAFALNFATTFPIFRRFIDGLVVLMPNLWVASFSERP